MQWDLKEKFQLGSARRASTERASLFHFGIKGQCLGKSLGLILWFHHCGWPKAAVRQDWLRAKSGTFVMGNGAAVNQAIFTNKCTLCLIAYRLPAEINWNYLPRKCMLLQCKKCMWVFFLFNNLATFFQWVCFHFRGDQLQDLPATVARQWLLCVTLMACGRSSPTASLTYKC